MMDILHYTFEIEHPQYGIDYTHRYYYNCTYEEGFYMATSDLIKAGWKILAHSCHDIHVTDVQELKKMKAERNKD